MEYQIPKDETGKKYPAPSLCLMKGMIALAPHHDTVFPAACIHLCLGLAAQARIHHLHQGCGSKSGSGFNRVCGSGSGFGIRIRIQEGKNDPQKFKSSCFEVLDGLFGS
jgi:hypothetical protein